MSFCLQLDVADWRPPGASHPNLRVGAEGNVVYQTVLVSGQGRQVLTVPALDIENAGAPTLEVGIEVDTWRPSQALGTSDARELGLAVFGIEIGEESIRPFEY